jgi:hypothetical protein
MANDLSKVVKTSGGTVVGEVRHTLNTSDFHCDAPVIKVHGC